MKSPFLLSICLIFTAFGWLQAQGGRLDNTFGTNGIVITRVENYGSSQATAVAVQKDGKIVAGGWVGENNSSDPTTNFALVRYNTDGSLDKTFNFTGQVETTFGYPYYLNRIYSIAIQEDGKIVAVGIVQDDNTSYFGIARYNTDGSQDLTFNQTGLVISFEIGWGGANSVHIQPDGKIVVTGWKYDNYYSAFALARYNTDGTMDSGFNGSGVLLIPSSDKLETYGSAIQPDGKIVVVGQTHDSLLQYEIVLSRFNSNGTIDNGFGTGGTVTASLGSDGLPEKVGIQPDGKIVVTSGIRINSMTQILIARFLQNGNLDISFNGTGMVTSQDGYYVIATALVIQSDGKIVIAGAGNTGLYGFYDFNVTRYEENGQLDSSFGTNGSVTTDVDNGSDDRAYGMALAPDGKIVIAGSREGAASSAFVVARYLTSGVQAYTCQSDCAVVYPNPISDHTTLEFVVKNQEQLTIRMFNMAGQLIRSYVENARFDAGRQQMDIEFPTGLPAGVYVMSLTSAQGKTSVKIVK
jgi:uncharacterized delta-60 repeat protein